MNWNTAENNRASGPSVFRTALCCCLLAVMLLASVSAAGEAASPWEERMERAREKYNAQTVNVFVKNYGYYRRGKINVCFYRAGKKPYYNINIRESLQITDEAEMEAVLELAAENEHYSAEEYGTVSFMKAEWITHNIAYSLANGSREQRELVEMITGEDVRKIVGHAKELDLSPLSAMTEKEIMLYRMVEYAFCRQE